MPGLPLMYLQTLIFLVEKYKSLMQTLNKNGPSTDACGAPESICVHLVKPLFGIVLCHLLF